MPPMPPMHEEIEVRIADLVPSEASVIGPSVKEKRQAFREGKPMYAAVVRVDGGLLVVDGHHTIRALLEEGQDKVRCRVRCDPDPQHAQRRRDVFLQRKNEGLTFASLPVDESESARTRRTEAEMDAEMDAKFMDALGEQLGGEPLVETGDDEIKFE